MLKPFCFAFRPSIKAFAGCIVALAAAVSMPLAEAQLPAVMVFGSRTALPTIGATAKIARDAAGNIYILTTGTTTTAVWELPVNGPLQIVVPNSDVSIQTTLSNTTLTMGVDPAGDIYLTRASGNNTGGVVKIPRLANGTYNYAGETDSTTLAAAGLTGGYYQANDMAVDPSGNVFVTSQAGTPVSATGWAGLGILMYGPDAPNGKVLVISTTAPSKITTDAAGDVFYVDGTNLWELTAAMVQSDTVVTAPIKIGTAPVCTVGCTALTTPKYVYLDNSGDIYVGNSTNLYVIPYSTTFSTTSPVYQIANANLRGYDYGAVTNTGDLVTGGYSSSVLVYGASRYYIGATTPTPYIGGPLAAGTTLTNSYANPAGILFFTQYVTLGSTLSSFLGSGSAYGGTGAVPIASEGGGSCTANTTYAPGSTCYLGVGYQPVYPGSMSGAVVVYGCPSTSSGTCNTGYTNTSVLTTFTAASLVTGPALTVDTGIAATIGTGYEAPSGIAVDNTGAMYVADPDANAVYKYAAGSAVAGTSFGSGLSEPSGVALDPAGNLYIADTGNNRVVVVPNGKTGGPSTANQIVLATPGYALSSPRGIAVDSFGDIFISDTGNARVLEVANPYAGAAGTIPTVITSSLNTPYGIAFDPYNNLFIADAGANAVYEIPTQLLTTSSVAPSSTVPNAGSGNLTTIGSGFSAPLGVATDGSGSVYITDSGNKRIVKIPNESGTLNPADQVTLFSGLNKPFGIATDLTADLYYTDQLAPTVAFVKRSAATGTTAATLAFGTEATGSTASLTALLSNSGLTTSLTFGSTIISAPTPNPPFSLTSVGCLTTLAPGKSCSAVLGFTPAAVGSFTGSATITDNAGNTTGRTQLISLSGDSVGAVATLTLSGPSSITYGDTASFTVVAKDGSGNIVTLPAGTAYSLTGATCSSPCTLNAGGSFFLPNLTVSGTAYSLKVTINGVVSNAVAVTVTKAPLYITGVNTSRLFDAVNPTFATPIYTGYVNGDTYGTVVSTAATSSSATLRNAPLGSYTTIIPSGGTLTPFGATNYSPVYVAGDLTITGSVPQSIFFAPLPNLTHGATTYTLTALASSGLPVVYQVTSGSATVTGTVLTVTAAGSVSVTAYQYGNNTYAAAATVTRTFTAQ